MANAIELAHSIAQRQTQLRRLLGDAEYDRQVSETRPLLQALVESGEHPSQLAAVLDLAGKDKELSAVQVNLLICAATEPTPTPPEDE